MSLVNELVEAGIHFGQRRSNWNPKMAPYIHGIKNQIHIIDIRETVKGVLLAKKFISRTVGSGKDVLFVGTKRQARGAIEQHALHGLADVDDVDLVLAAVDVRRHLRIPVGAALPEVDSGFDEFVDE